MVKGKSKGSDPLDELLADTWILKTQLIDVPFFCRVNTLTSLITAEAFCFLICIQFFLVLSCPANLSGKKLQECAGRGAMSPVCWPPQGQLKSIDSMPNSTISMRNFDEFCACLIRS